MLVDSRASDHFVDDELNSNLRERMSGYKTLDEPKPIETAGKRNVFATATGTILCGHIINTTGQRIYIRIFTFIVTGMGRHLFSPATAMKSGVNTILQA